MDETFRDVGVGVLIKDRLLCGRVGGVWECFRMDSLVTCPYGYLLILRLALLYMDRRGNQSEEDTQKAGAP